MNNMYADSPLLCICKVEGEIHINGVNFKAYNWHEENNVVVTSWFQTPFSLVLIVNRDILGSFLGWRRRLMGFCGAVKWYVGLYYITIEIITKENREQEHFNVQGYSF